jgi:putative membrane protein
MMWGYGPGWGWMVLMPVVWMVLLGAIIWAVVRLVQGSTGRGSAPQAGSTPPVNTETAQEILDRRYASGEIDTDTYNQMRGQLTGRGAGVP